MAQMPFRGLFFSCSFIWQVPSVTKCQAPDVYTQIFLSFLRCGTKETQWQTRFQAEFHSIGGTPREDAWPFFSSLREESQQSTLLLVLHQKVPLQTRGVLSRHPERDRVRCAGNYMRCLKRLSNSQLKLDEELSPKTCKWLTSSWNDA